MAFIVHPRWLAANTIKVELLAASQRRCKIIAIDCMYSKLSADDEYNLFEKCTGFIGKNLKIKYISFVLITPTHNEMWMQARKSVNQYFISFTFESFILEQHSD